MNEIWKDVVNYEGLYQISNLGRVKSIERLADNGYNIRLVKEKIRVPRKCRYGYLKLNLSKDGNIKTQSVHKLVAEAFLNHIPCGTKLVINHINFIRTDNRSENLEIVTTIESTSHRKAKSSSQYTGVSWNPSVKKWHSQIHFNGKKKHLGNFIKEYDAHLAYQNILTKIKNGSI